MINYILTKYYYYKYLWTIKKSIGSLSAIKQIESGPHPLIKDHKFAEVEVARARTGSQTKTQILSIIKDH